MPNAFFPIQILNAGAFLLLAALPLLILAYLRKKSQRKTVVSSLIIFRALQKRTVRKRRFKPPLRFFLELAALLLLAAAAAQLEFDRRGMRTAIVVDTTLSMRARETEGGKQTRIEKALALAEDWLAKHGEGLFSLYTSSPQLRLVGEELTSAADVRGLLQKIKPTLGSDTLETSVIQLAESGKFERLIVVSDRSAEWSDSPEYKAGSEETEWAEVVDLHVGHPVANAFLRDFKFVPPAIDSATPGLIASIGFAGLTPVDISLRLTASSPPAGQAIEIGRRTARIYPSEMTPVRFDLPTESSAFSLFRADLSIENSPGQEGKNSISEDDSAWLNRGSGVSAALAVISPDLTDSSVFGFSAMSALAVESKTPADYAQLSAADLEKFALLVFHKSAPAEFPRQPAAFILPPVENKLFPVRSEVIAPQVSSWLSSHPITSYLRIPLLKPGAAALLDLPDWAECVLNSEEGCMVAAGEVRGVRYAAVGFEVLPFEGTKTPAPSVLVLNLLNWLSGGKEFRSGLLTGTNLRLEPGDSWSIIDPQQNVRTVETKNGKPAFVPLEQAGPYRITAERAGEPRLLAVNTFYPDESATTSNNPYRLYRHIRRTGVPQDTIRPLWPVLTALALAFLLFEFLLHFFLSDSNTEKAEV